MGQHSKPEGTEETPINFLSLSHSQMDNLTANANGDCPSSKLQG